MQPARPQDGTEHKVCPSCDCRMSKAIGDRWRHDHSGQPECMCTGMGYPEGEQ